MRDLVRQIERRGLVRVLRRYEFPLQRYAGGISNGILAVCQSSSTYLAEGKRLQEPIRAALVRTVPEIYSGEIEIMAIARLPDIGSKVAVRMASETKDSQEAVRLCLGQGGERIDAIRSAVNSALPVEEWIGVIAWHSDVKSFVVEALYPMQADDVWNVELDEDRIIATVFVNSPDSASRAIGQNGSNVRLAEHLVGWTIKIEVDSVSSQGEIVREDMRMAQNPKDIVNAMCKYLV